MDWMNLANSSIWDSVEGFGGDGQAGGPITVGEGRCVVDGSFAALKPIKYNHTYIQHCLSRGFRDNGTLGPISGLPFRPEIIGEVRRKKTYVEFEKAIEMHLHNAMHLGISGDFLALTAPDGEWNPLVEPGIIMDHHSYGLSDWYGPSRSYFLRTSCTVGPSLVAVAARRYREAVG